MSEDIFKNYGYAISDRDGDLRNISEIIKELEEVKENFSTHSMNEYAIFLNGQYKMLDDVIRYLKRV